MRVYFKSLFLVSGIIIIISLALNFSMFARASGTTRHLSATIFHPALPGPSQEFVVIDPADSWEFGGIDWWECYPDTGNWWNFGEANWVDSDLSGDLSASDYVEMTNDDTGEVKWFIVDRVTVAIHWWWDPDAPPGFDPFYPCYSYFTYWPVPEEPYWPLPDPLGSQWHMTYPSWSRTFEITGWEDYFQFDVFSIGDDFDITFLDDGTGPWHVFFEQASTDLILTETEEPPPSGVPEFSLIVASGLGFVIITVLLLRKRRLPKVSTT